MNFKPHTMALTTKMSLHMDKESRSKQEGKQLLCAGHLIFPSPVIVVDICGFCQASSQSPFFCTVLLISLWGTIPPYLSATWFRWISVYSPLQAWPSTAFCLLKHTWFKDTHMKSSSRANEARSRELCSHHWTTGTAGLCLLGKQHSSVEWLVATSTTARQESLNMNLTEKNRTKRLGEEKRGKRGTK